MYVIVVYNVQQTCNNKIGKVMFVCDSCFSMCTILNSKIRGLRLNMIDMFGAWHKLTYMLQPDALYK